MKWLHVLWLILIAVAALAVILMLGGPEKRPPELWTSDNPAALDAFRSCLEADTRRYFLEAIQSCTEAVDLDPDFAIAKLFLAGYLRDLRPERSKELIDQLRTADLSGLTTRERFLIRHRLLLFGGEEQDANLLLSGYLQDYPEDPWAISMRCNRLWLHAEPAVAAECYQRLLDADPNWVEAQNRLGYLAMAEGRFREAEEAFETYRYVAPDQANPHDSLGELLTLVGRYEDAEVELRRALSIRPDFCASYVHLIRLHLLEQDFDRARGVVRELEAQPSCETPPPPIELLRCGITAWELEAAADWSEIVELWRRCPQVPGDLQIFAHYALLRTGERQTALNLERQFEEGVEESKDFPGVDGEAMAAFLAYMRGNRFLLDGEPEAAAERFATADELLPYWNPEGLSLFKLFNQLAWTEALTRAGQTERARELLRKVRAVNPRAEETYWGALPTGTPADGREPMDGGGESGSRGHVTGRSGDDKMPPRKDTP